MHKILNNIRTWSEDTRLDFDIAFESPAIARTFSQFKPVHFAQSQPGLEIFEMFHPQDALVMQTFMSASHLKRRTMHVYMSIVSYIPIYNIFANVLVYVYTPSAVIPVYPLLFVFMVRR